MRQDLKERVIAHLKRIAEATDELPTLNGQAKGYLSTVKL
jgi:hypothetical protein